MTESLEQQSIYQRSFNTFCRIYNTFEESKVNDPAFNSVRYIYFDICNIPNPALFESTQAVSLDQHKLIAQEFIANYLAPWNNFSHEELFEEVGMLIGVLYSEATISN